MYVGFLYPPQSLQDASPPYLLSNYPGIPSEMETITATKRTGRMIKKTYRSRVTGVDAIVHIKCNEVLTVICNTRGHTHLVRDYSF